MADEDLSRLEAWIGEIIAGLAPAERRRASLRVAQALRRANLDRIAANMEPSGDPMERRRPRLGRDGKVRPRSGRKMFRGLRALRNWKIDADEDGVEIAPVNGLVARIAEINHFGETATVGRLRDGRRIRHRYQERRLLGFSPEDEATILDIAADLISRVAR
ncbi:phage virion morphogenesis protein [Sphingomonas sp.]|uniref:phage virion morphogenesis protein n=1 Tax=Sphingomonas sp. TaxID=28214 RepID=UPI00307DEB99